MLSIGIVGSDNSHALAFASLLNNEQLAGDDARATCIWGAEKGRTQEVAAKANIDRTVASPEDMIGLVDAIFVEDRHGGLHAEHALPFLERGIPVFVDKPLACSLEDCGRIIAAANANNTFVTSFSSLRTCASTTALAEQVAGIGRIRSCQFAGPCDFESIYGGPYFYATHTVEISLRLVGEDVRSISAVRSGNMVAANVIWANDTLGTYTFIGDAEPHFHATLFGTHGMVSGEILPNHEGYRTACGLVLEGLTTGKRPLTDEELVRPIAIVQAMEQSLAKNGATIEIAPLIAAALAVQA
jgi:predicted dehydrogenase